MKPFTRYLNKLLLYALLIGGLGFAPSVSMALSGGQTLKIHEGKRDTYVRLRDVSSFHSADFTKEADGTLRMLRETGDLTIPKNGRRVNIDGITVWLHSPVELLKRKYSITETDYRSVVQPILDPTQFLRGRGALTVLLDPGHGGEDSGAQGLGVDEKDLVLQVAHDVRQELVQHGFKVLMTREFDRFIPLGERSKLARTLGADFMVSLHANSAGNKTARGVETYVVTARGYASTTSPVKDGPDRAAPGYLGNDVAGASAVLGYALHRHVIKASGAHDRGLRHARFLVLRDTACPSALVEMGFLSNPEEVARMKTEEYMALVVDGLVQGVRAYAEQVKDAQEDLSEADSKKENLAGMIRTSNTEL